MFGNGSIRCFITGAATPGELHGELPVMYTLSLQLYTLGKMENERINCRLTEREAGDYIKLHKIMELFKNMTALLLYHRPGSRV